MTERGNTLEKLEEFLRRQLEGRLTEREAAAFEELLQEHPEASELYLRHCQMEAMLSEERETLALLAERDNVVTLPVTKTTEEQAEATGDRRASIVARVRAVARPLVFGVACAAAAVVAAVLLGRAGSRSSLPGDPGAVIGRESELVSEGQLSEAQLSDGSTIQLATKSVVAVHYTDRERVLELQGGEAYFSVVPDTDRPFIVAAGSVRVRAVGTAFNIRRAGERVVVTVTDGKVEVYRTTDPPKEPDARAPSAINAVIVAAGSQVRWGGGEPGLVLASVNPSQALAWREGRLEYTNEPLQAVIVDLNRYSDRPIVIRDEAIGRLRVTGTVLTKSAAQWLATLPTTFPVTVELQQGSYVIFARETPGASG